jgi:hypothetical protein
MKKISVLICIFLLSFGVGFSQHSRVKIIEIKNPPPKPKKEPTPAKLDKAWYLTFELTIKGSGSNKGKNPDSELEWDFDRSYSGTIALDLPSPMIDSKWSQAEVMESIRTQRKTSWMHMPKMGLAAGAVPSDVMAPIKVKIDDKVRSLTKDKGEGNTFENTTVNTHWEFDDTVFTTNATMLILDKKLNTYNVMIALKPFDRTDVFTKVRVTSETNVNRSQNGYGGLPTSETNTEHNSIFISEIQFPLTAILRTGQITHPVDLPLRIKDGGYEYDSGDLEPDKPMIEGEPKSKQTVKIHIYYRFKRL